MGLNVGLKQKAGMTRLAKLLNLKMSRAGYAHRRVGACWVFAASLRRVVGRFCAKKAGAFA
jgi:hypothetical protein